MLAFAQQVDSTWPARLRAKPLAAVLTLSTEGLVLGVGTVLVAATTPRRLGSLRAQESRVLALLAVAYGKPIAPSVLGNIARAAKAWREGDDCLAHIHLAHTGLHPLNDVRAAAHRLFLADGALRAGASSRDVLEALHLDVGYIDAVEKYSPDQPRVPKGSGRTSGEWTDGEEEGGVAVPEGEQAGDEPRGPSLLGRMPLPAASFLGELSVAQVAELATYAARLLGPAGAAVAAFGLLFIPSSNNVHVEGDVPEIPGLRYSWNRDETQLYLTYSNADGGPRTFTAYLDDDVFRDEQGKVIGRVLSDNNIAIDAIAVSPDLANEDEPNFCPAPGPDKPNERGREYEDYVKTVVNPPPNTTPSGIGFQLPNPEDSGKLVYYDDCQRETGMMVDAKGTAYAVLLTFPSILQSIVYEWVDESGRQIAASGGRPVRWYFAEKDAADFARELSRDYDDGRERIEIEFLPWQSEDHE